MNKKNRRRYFFLMLILVGIFIGSYQLSKTGFQRGGRDVGIPSSYINVTKFGVKTIKKNQLSAIQTIINTRVMTGSTLYFPSGEYWVDLSQTSINLKSNMKVVLADGAVIRQLPTSKQYFSMFNLFEIENVTIEGGKIVGDRYTHLTTSGWGYGIALYSAKNVQIKNIKIEDMYGDGIFIGSSTFTEVPGAGSQNVTIDEVISSNNMRQGLTVVAAKDVYVKNSTFKNSNGMDPEAGVSLERDPNAEGDYDELAENIQFDNCRFEGNAGYGLAIVFFNNSAVSVYNSIFTANNGGGIYFGQSDKALLSNNNIYKNKGNGIHLSFSQNITMENNQVYQNDRSGIYGLNKISQLTIKNNMIQNNKASGIYMFGFTTVDEKLFVEGNIISGNLQSGMNISYFKDSTIIGNLIAKNGQYGITTADFMTSVISYNTISNNGKDGIYLLYSDSNNVWNNLISGNGTLTDNTYANIYLYQANHNTVSYNLVTLGLNKNAPKYGIYNESFPTNKILSNQTEGSGKTASEK